MLPSTLYLCYNELEAQKSWHSLLEGGTSLLTFRELRMGTAGFQFSPMDKSILYQTALDKAPQQEPAQC